jgi:hypothetical protein
MAATEQNVIRLRKLAGADPNPATDELRSLRKLGTRRRVQRTEDSAPRP